MALKWPKTSWEWARVMAFLTMVCWAFAAFAFFMAFWTGQM